ncbi:alpha/beta hydrolase fold domain-containing protein [Streptomyces brasiliensis]|uniref:Alpha/beta hydrolase fold-3 domain-containing protein n=1 Tax=Streptomyces brasiliensis TaxID=1954 RepID=A0A917P5S4_9ACTN|nr:alpha/beta hydrolase fold domain-containing protein [Streptomyces brasiliensis]GGJ62989.1 hypothetical protein GCM10010121_087080 [Streptomyces brasiliensis]
MNADQDMGSHRVPPFDPKLIEALESLEVSPASVSFTDETLPMLRAATALGQQAIADELARHGVELTDHVIDGPRGEIVLSRLAPQGGVTSAPAVYFIHGGGMLIGDRFCTMSFYNLVDLVATLGLVVLTVEYRMAPEHPGRAAVDDCYAGLAWLGEHAAQLGVDPSRIILAGTSGGGGLAAGTALLARDVGGPRLLAQVLWCPQVDDRSDSVSARQFGKDASTGVTWSREDHQYAWNTILGQGHEDQDVSIYLAANRATDLSGLPPAFIDVGANDVFRDPAVEYASKLWASGVATELHVWPGGLPRLRGALPRRSGIDGGPVGADGMDPPHPRAGRVMPEAIRDRHMTNPGDAVCS